MILTTSAVMGYGEMARTGQDRHDVCYCRGLTFPRSAGYKCHEHHAPEIKQTGERDCEKGPGMRNKRGKTHLPTIIIGVACTCVAVALYAWLRRSLRGRETTYESAPNNSPDIPAKKIAFADPTLPTAEPPSDRALVARVQALAEAKPQEAAPALKAIVKDTRDPAALTIAATVAQKLPAEDAISVYREIIAKGNAPSYAYMGLAQALAGKGQGEEACAVYREGLVAYPTGLALREAYAKYLAGLGRAKDAVDVCLIDMEGKDTRPNSMRRCILAGEILWNAGAQDQAREMWRRLVQMAETAEEGRRYYAQVLARHNSNQ